ncbi:MAG: NAD(P)-dependent oxidoreductase [Nitrospiraceae bacterium]|nr:MAG: NAD(P)-dependent oxidoreductase [Nitrospiraceae bacterium]
MKVLITGASGFIGSHLVERLLVNGFEITCLTRNASRPEWLEGLDISLIQGDCSDREFLYKSVRGYDYIFHLAGITKTNQRNDYYDVNTAGTENIISAVAHNNPNIKRFVYISSLSAFGPKVNKSIPIENEIPHPVSDYGNSKLSAEKALHKYISNIPISILRPSAVYGPRDREVFLIFQYIKKGVIPSWGKGHTSLIYIDDLIDAVILASESTLAIGKTYFISDGEIYSNENILKEISSTLHVKPLTIRVPRNLLSVIGFLSDVISTMIGKKTMINRDKCKELMYSEWVCDINKARSDLGFKPKVGLKEGIQWTADWYKIHKWL